MNIILGILFAKYGLHFMTIKRYYTIRRYITMEVLSRPSWTVRSILLQHLHPKINGVRTIFVTSI